MDMFDIYKMLRRMDIKYKRGFTLVELLVVIAIIAILVSLLVPTVWRSIGRAKWTADANHLRQQGTVAYQYAADHNGHLPRRHYTHDPSTAYIGNASGGVDVYKKPSNYGCFLADGYLEGREFDIFWSPWSEQKKHYWDDGEAKWHVDRRSGMNRHMRADYLFNPLYFRKLSSVAEFVKQGKLEDERWQYTSYKVLSINRLVLDDFTEYSGKEQPRAKVLLLDGSVRTYRCDLAYEDLKSGRYETWDRNWSNFEDLMFKILHEQKK